MSRVVCPVPRCTRPKVPSHLMCTTHWRMVSKETRDAVWTAWRDRNEGRKGAVDAHELAKREAINEAIAAGDPPQAELAI